MKARAELQSGRFNRCKALVEKVGLLHEPGKLKVWAQEEGKQREAEQLEAPLVYLLRGAASPVNPDSNPNSNPNLYP